MPEFQYLARRRDGEEVSGAIAASNRTEAYESLRRTGLIPSSIEAAGGRVQSVSAKRQRPKLRHQQSWAERMATLLEADITLERALDLTADVDQKDPMGPISKELIKRIREGETLTQAVESLGVFRPSVTGILAASEQTGDSSAAFRAIADLMGKSLELQRTVGLALTYPLLLLVVAVISVVLMLGLVVPKFEGLIGGENIPATTQVVMDASAALRAHTWWIVAGIGIIILTCGAAFRSTRGQAALQWAGFALPLIGPVLHDLTLSSLFRNLGMFLKSGIPMLESLRLSSRTILPGRHADAVNDACGRIGQGGQLSQALIESEAFPRSSIDMIRAGEESAHLDKMLITLADNHEAEARSAIKRMLTILEPALIVIIGAVIGGIIFAIFQAILSINDIAI